METKNFFKQNRKMKNSWYKGTTGLPPLDYAIKNALNNGWSHHIERLMILSNIMNLCEIKPKIVSKLTISDLRKCGLSRMKAKGIKSQWSL